MSFNQYFRLAENSNIKSIQIIINFRYITSSQLVWEFYFLYLCREITNQEKILLP